MDASLQANTHFDDSTDPRRLQSLATLTGIALQREHCYALYRAAGNPLP